MSNRNLAILAVVAAILVVLAVMQSRFGGTPQGGEAAVQYLIQGLDPDRIARIVVGRGGDQVTLDRRERQFVVTNLDNYPALTDEINRVIAACLDVQTSELYTRDPAYHKDLSVTEEDAATIVKFYSADSNLITGIIVGKPREQARGTFIRRVNDNSVYVTRTNPWIKSQPVDYVNQELANVLRENIESVTVSGPNETYMLRPGPDASSVVLDNMPEGKKLKDTVANRVLTALAGLRLEGVRQVSSAADALKFDMRFVAKLKDSTVYTFRIAREDDKVWVTCDAQFLDQTPVTMTQGQIESEEELKKKEAKLLANEAAQKFSANHRGWMYQIPSYRAENMMMKMSEMLEDLPKPDANEPAEAQSPASAEEGGANPAEADANDTADLEQMVEVAGEE